MANSKKPERIAAIDLGTNSIHLLIARVIQQTGGFEVLDHDRDRVRLGAGIGPHGELTDQAITQAIGTLRDFQMRAKASGAALRIVATSAVREASNREMFLERVRKDLGMEIEIASGYEEARLTYLAVRKAVDPGSRLTLMVDIGGGSTEFVVGLGDDILYDNSIKLGAVRLSRAFFPDGKTDSKSVAECRKFCTLSLNPIRRNVFDHGYEWAVGSSGTVQCIGRIIMHQRGSQVSGRLNRISFSANELHDSVERVLSAKTTEGRAKLKGVDEGRADVIAAGALLLETVAKELEIENLTISEFSLREGILFDTIERSFQRKQFLSHEGLRFRSVMHLAQQFNYERVHSEHVSKLALSIFDQTAALHALGDIERELLEAASLLHDIGLFISYSDHHKHSYYLIRHSQLLGFADYEQQIIAHVARYHRKSPPRKSHLDFMNLPRQQQALVSKLAGILRIADGLDRTHASAVSALNVRIDSKNVTFELTPNKSQLLTYSIWGAERKRDLFESAFDRKALFTPVEASV